MKGRFRATSAVYPLHSLVGWRRNWDSTLNVALCLRVPAAGDRAVIICAFCLRTSAGVRMKQETDSAMEEAMPWMTGVGRGWVNGRRFFSGVGEDEEEVVRSCLMVS